MQKKTISILIASLGFSTSGYANEDWLNVFKQVVTQVATEENIAKANTALSNTEVISGLKEALANGVETAINTLGRPNGFLANELVRISVPDSLKTLSNTARHLGQGQYVDSFETTLNQAAEKAVPEVSAIFADAIRQMSVADALNILNGSDNAATQYFKKVSEKSLLTKLKPIVSQATNQAGVTAAYKNLTGQASPLLTGLLNDEALDLDQYVSKKALDGLFTYIAQEEKRIRQNPAARTTGLLQKVFGKN